MGIVVTIGAIIVIVVILLIAGLILPQDSNSKKGEDVEVEKDMEVGEEAEE